MKFLTTIFISLLFFSCSNDNSQKVSAIIDSLAKKDSVKKVVAKISEDSLKKIDSLVSEIRKKIAENILQKKTGNPNGDEDVYGWIYELFDKDNLVYEYSDDENEFGATAMECFFQNGLPVYVLVDRIKFGKKDKDEIDYSIRIKTATEKIYFSGNKILQQNTETFTNEKRWQKIPYENKLLERIKNIDADINQSGVWVKK